MTDALASLQQWKVTFRVGAGHAFTIPSLPAADWIEAILTGDVAGLLDDDDTERLTDLAADGEVSGDDLERVFADIVAEAAGREWQVGTRLVALLLDDQIRGEAFGRIDPGTRPLAAVLDVIYALVVRWMATDKRAEFDGKLNTPPESAPGTSDPREHARQMRERSKRLLAQREALSGQPEATDTPSNEQPPTSD